MHRILLMLVLTTVDSVTIQWIMKLNCTVSTLVSSLVVLFNKVYFPDSMHRH